MELFDLASYTWPVHELRTRRAEMRDQLIFDILLSAGGIRQPHLLYPPANAQDLHALLEAIQTSTYDTLKRDSLVYFLLKWHKDPSDRHLRYAADRAIPTQFTLLADAYWSLDAGKQVALAVSTLADSRLNRDYSSKILQAISLSPMSAPLILKYVHTAKPPLVEPDDIDLYVLALAETALLDAWRFMRTFADGEETKERLVRKILTYCLAPKPNPAVMSLLLSLPFSPSELALVKAFALNPPSIPTTSVPVIHDFVFTHLLSKADYMGALEWARTLESSPLSTREHVKRAIEERRDQVDVLKSMFSGADIIPTSASASHNIDMDIDASWEDLGKSLAGKTIQVPSQPVEVTAEKSPALNGLFPTNAIKPAPPTPPPPPPTLSAKVAPKATLKVIQPNGNKATTPLIVNKTRNAFYEPPPPPPTLPLIAPSTSEDINGHTIQADVVDDVGMETEDDVEIIRRAKRRLHEDDEDMDIQPQPEAAEQEFSTSVFRPSTPPQAPVVEERVEEQEVEEPAAEIEIEKKKRPTKDKRPKKMERTKTRHLPGAFLDEGEPAPAPPPIITTISTRSTRSSTAKTPTRTSARKSTASSKSISIPGSLMSEEEEEETNEVLPLPPAKKVKETPAPRRSSRLSVDKSAPAAATTATPRKGRKKA